MRKQTLSSDAGSLVVKLAHRDGAVSYNLICNLCCFSGNVISKCDVNIQNDMSPPHGLRWQQHGLYITGKTTSLKAQVIHSCCLLLLNVNKSMVISQLTNQELYVLLQQTCSALLNGMTFSLCFLIAVDATDFIDVSQD